VDLSGGESRACERTIERGDRSCCEADSDCEFEGNCCAVFRCDTERSECGQQTVANPNPGDSCGNCCESDADCVEEDNRCKISECDRGRHSCKAPTANVSEPGCCDRDQDCPVPGNPCALFACNTTEKTCTETKIAHDGGSNCCDPTSDDESQCDDGNDCTDDECIGFLCKNNVIEGCCTDDEDCNVLAAEVCCENECLAGPVCPPV
jgi:hypothetical protein